MRLWPGSCYAHVLFTKQSIERCRLDHPGAPVVAHPECVRTVRELADEVCSTEKMVSFCKDHPSDAFIVLTETGMMHRLVRELPDKTFVAGPTDHCACNDCRDRVCSLVRQHISREFQYFDRAILAEARGQRGRAHLAQVAVLERQQFDGGFRGKGCQGFAQRQHVFQFEPVRSSANQIRTVRSECYASSWQRLNQMRLTRIIIIFENGHRGGQKQEGLGRRR